jgi:5-formyltetrahydrofolate cyclo-ligase
MKKEELRKIYREKRAALKQSELSKLQDLLLIRFQQVPLPFITVLHRFLPARGKHEVDTEPMANWLSFCNPGLVQLIPKVNASTNDLHHYQLKDDTVLILNEWGIPEPEKGLEISPVEIDLVLIPLLAFDETGHRVGYGKGYYDRFLASCRPDCIKTGLSFFPPADIITDTNTFDIAMDFCITPERIYEF